MTDSMVVSWARPSAILVATDLSDLDRLMPVAFDTAADCDARLILLHVLGAPNALSVDAAGMPCHDSASMMEYVGRILEPCCAEARRNNIRCDIMLREGSVAQQIAAVSRQLRAGRILLGTRSRSKTGRFLLGSVVEQVLRSVNLPVMTVGPEAHLAVGSSDQQRIVLHATTLRETSRPSAALACHIAAAQGARLIFLHVLPPADNFSRETEPEREEWYGMESVAQRELCRLGLESGAAACVSVDHLVMRGNPTIEILAEASGCGASLIVLGVSPYTSFDSLTRDQVAARVIAHARCPVLILCEHTVNAVESGAERLAFHG